MIDKIKNLLISFGVAVGVILTAYLRGKSDQKDSEKIKDLESIKRGSEIDKKVRDMPKSDIDRNIDRWMRD